MDEEQIAKEFEEWTKNLMNLIYAVSKAAWLEAWKRYAIKSLDKLS